MDGDKMNGSALIEFKVLKIDFLDLLSDEEKPKVQDVTRENRRRNEQIKTEREAKMVKMETYQSNEEILNICFEEKDKFHNQFGTIKDFIERECMEQLFNYYSKGIPETKEFQDTMSLYVVVLVGGRKLIVAEIDKITKKIRYTVH